MFYTAFSSSVVNNQSSFEKKNVFVLFVELVSEYYIIIFVHKFYIVLFILGCYFSLFM